MMHYIAIDPATTSGIAIVRDTGQGPPDALTFGFCSFEGRRTGWIGRALSAVRAQCIDAHVDPAESTWLIETWARHSHFDTAVKLAQIQQVWVDVAAMFNANVIFVEVMDWQVPLGVNQASRAAGKGPKMRGDRRSAGKAAAQRWARATYRLTEEVQEDAADALCMAGWWVQSRRGQELPLGR